LKKTVTASILVIVIVVVVALGFLFFKSSSLVVPFMQPTQITVNEVQYTLIGDANSLVVYTGIAPLGTNSKTLTRPVVGETYPCLGIDVKILEIHADRYVVSVTPNDAKPDENSDGSIGFMGTEELKITSMTFNTGYILATVSNTGTTPVTINEIWINNVKQAYTPQTVTANSGTSIEISYSWTAGNNYQLKLISSKGNAFVYTAIAPT
jgi:hypothetical protein